MHIDNKYKDYSVEDFLKDAFFVKWQLMPNEALDVFWKLILQTFPHQKNNLETACKIFQSTTINRSSLSNEEENEMLRCIYDRYHKYKIRRIIYWSTSIAASLLLFFFILTPITERCAINNILVAFEDSIQPIRLDTIQDVQLMIGKTKTMAMAEDANIYWSKADEIQMKGQSSNTTFKSPISEIVEYSTLLVPYGKRSFITLPDSTKIWVNSGTKLRFPTQMKGNERRVWVDGEIYLEVTRNESSPFYIQTSAFDVKVYGTKFNVDSYSSDTYKSVVLVEGSVSVSAKENKGREMFLKPNQLYEICNLGNRVKNVDASRYITWKNGILQFESEQLATIALKLSRYYGIKIHCDKMISSKSCTGKLILLDDADKTLQTIEDIFGVQCTFVDPDNVNISVNLKKNSL